MKVAWLVRVRRPTVAPAGRASSSRKVTAVRNRGHTGSDLYPWAATRGRLREITSGDVDAVLEPLRGHRRYNAITALRSLFRFAKRHGLTFADPTRHLSGGRSAGRTVLPMTAEQIRAVQQAAVTPAHRLDRTRIAGLRPVQVGSSAAARLSDSHRLKSAVLQLR